MSTKRILKIKSLLYYSLIAIFVCLFSLFIIICFSNVT